MDRLLPLVILCACSLFSFAQHSDLDITHLRQGDIINMGDLRFEAYSAKITDFESKETLDRLYQLLLDHPIVHIEVRGHTCDNPKGRPIHKDYAILLSRNRAMSVASFLTDTGFPVERIMVKGYGHTISIATNETEEGRQKNRGWK